MDILKTTEPDSAQQNYDDYMSAPKTVTVSQVKSGTKEQPLELHLTEFPGRPYKPGKSMRRVLVAAWGPEASVYVGRKLTLYGDPTIRFGKDAVGGIRISHLSHIDKPLEIPLTVTRGQRKPFVVQPLNVPEKPDQSVVDAVLADLMSASSLESLKAAWDLAGVRGVQSHSDLIAAKDARKTELTATVRNPRTVAPSPATSLMRTQSTPDETPAS